jgi:hypothetical protein
VTITEGHDASISKTWGSWQEISKPQHPTSLVCPCAVSIAFQSMYGYDTSSD